MKLRKVCLVFISFVLACAPFMQGIEINIKLSGGLATLSPRQVNAMLEGWAERTKREAAFQNWGFGGRPVAILRNGFHFEGEILVNLTRRIGLGLSAGHIYSDVVEDNTSLSVNKGETTYIYARPAKVTGSPLLLSGYYFLPLGKEASFYVKAGSGWLWATYVEREANKKLGDTRFLYPTLQTATSRGQVYQAGLGLRCQIEPTMGFFLEVTARKAKISGFKGENKAAEKGDLYFFEEYDPSLDYWQAKIQILPSEPSGENYRSVQKVSVDFGGYSFRIGVFIKF